MQPPRPAVRLTTLAVLLCTLAGLVGLRGPWPALSTSYASEETTAAEISFDDPGALQTTIAAGDDFATNVLGDAWDMNVARDLGYEIGFSGISASNGIWSGTYSGVDQASGRAATGYIFPLFQGFSTPMPSGNLSQELALTKIGSLDQYAINAAKYTQLSYRMSVSPRSASSPLAVYWTTAKPTTWPAGENRFAQADTCGSVPWDGWHVYNFDMSQPNGDPAARAGAWQGMVRGLRIDPSAAGAAGTQVQIDWIRLSDPSSAATISIPWSTSDAFPGDTVDIYVADNPAGTDAAPIAYGIPASQGSYDLATSALPPGDHYFQLRLGSCFSTKASSSFVGPLTIAPAPVITFAKPSMTSGPDYASEVLGQPWDMSDGGDIITPGPPYPETLSEKSFANGIFSARAMPPAVGVTESDAQIWLNVDANRPINANRYRYFTVRLKVDMPADKDINWAIANGWGARIIWWNTGIQADGSESKFGAYYEGWRNYSVDLARAIPPLALPNASQDDNILTPREQNPFPAQLGWAQLGTVANLRFDPLETTQPAVGSGADVFSIDWVKLTANDEVRRGTTFPIEVGVNVQPSSLQSVDFYYTTDRGDPTQNPALRTAPLAARPAQADPNTVFLPLLARPTLNPVVGNPLVYNWNTASVAPGTYYICSVANTGFSSTTYCSDTPVVVMP